MHECHLCLHVPLHIVLLEIPATKNPKSGGAVSLYIDISPRPASDTITLRDLALETCSRRCAVVLVQYASKPERSDFGEHDDATHDNNRFNT